MSNPPSTPTKSDSTPGPTLRELLPLHIPQIEILVRRNLSRTLLDRESASDLVASVCGDLLADGIQFEYRGEGQFQSWLRVVVINKIRHRLRSWQTKKHGPVWQASADGLQIDAAHIDTESPSQQAILCEELGLLDRALARLSDNHRDIIVRTRLRGQSHAVVAADLGRTVQATRNLLTRALVKLAGELDRLQNGR